MDAKRLPGYPIGFGEASASADSRVSSQRRRVCPLVHDMSVVFIFFLFFFRLGFHVWSEKGDLFAVRARQNTDAALSFGQSTAFPLSARVA